MLDKIKEYIDSINFYELSMSELAEYTKIVIMLQQLENSEQDKKKLYEALNKSKSIL